MKVCVLANPRAGSAGQLDAVREALTRAVGPDVTVVGLEPDDDLKQLAAAVAGQKFDLLAVAGGDGTVHAVVNGLAPWFPRVPLAVLPLGTGNDLARTLAIPLDPVAAVGVLRTGRTRPFDVVKVEGGPARYMVNAATGGFSGRVASEVTHELKETWGPLAYLRGAVGPVAELPRYRLTVRLDGGDPETFDALNVVVANARTAGGGLAVAPTANPEDGRLDFVAVRATDALDLGVVAARLLAGDYTSDENVVHRRVAKVEIEADVPVPFSIDGELTEGTRFVFAVVPAALRVVTGPGYVAEPPREPPVEETDDDTADDEAPPQPAAAPAKGLGPRLFGLAAGLLIFLRKMPRGYVAGLFLVGVAVLVFAGLAHLVVGNRVAAVNEAAMRYWYAHRTPELNRVAVAVTWLADAGGVAVLSAGIGVFFWLRRRYLDAVTFAAVMLGVLVMMGVLKLLFAVPRPDLFERLQTVSGYSFPSGHALRAVGMFGFLAAVLVAGGPRRVWRWLAAAGCVVVAAAVCWSRVYIGVHWPTDVLAGAAAAAAWVTACMMVRHYAKTRPPRAGPVPADAHGGRPGQRVG